MVSLPCECLLSPKGLLTCSYLFIYHLFVSSVFRRIFRILPVLQSIFNTHVTIHYPTCLALRKLLCFQNMLNIPTPVCTTSRQYALYRTQHDHWTAASEGVASTSRYKSENWVLYAITFIFRTFRKINERCNTEFLLNLRIYWAVSLVGLTRVLHL